MPLLVSCRSSKVEPLNLRPVTDELNRTIMVVPEPKRIISLAPSITEVLFAIGAGDRVVGVTTYCDYPQEAKAKEKVGDTTRPNLEKIVALKPDVIIASTASQLEQYVRNLESLGLAVYVSNPRDIEGVLASIAKMGELVGASGGAAQLTESMRRRIDEIHSRLSETARPSVFFVLATEPLMTVGGNTFLNDLITRAGGRSISSDMAGDYPQYSLEAVIARRPDLIFLGGGIELPERLTETPAVRAGRVYHIDDDLLFRPGPRIVDGLEQMAAKIGGR
jgi:iron complex transport system substrate-binding protein